MHIYAACRYIIIISCMCNAKHQQLYNILTFITLFNERERVNTKQQKNEIYTFLLLSSAENNCTSNIIIIIITEHSI